MFMKIVPLYILVSYKMVPYVLSRYAVFRIFLLLNFYDSASTFILIGIFFYVRHYIFNCFDFSLRFPLKLMTNSL